MPLPTHTKRGLPNRVGTKATDPNFFSLANGYLLGGCRNPEQLIDVNIALPPTSNAGSSSAPRAAKRNREDDQEIKKVGTIIEIAISNALKKANNGSYMPFRPDGTPMPVTEQVAQVELDELCLRATDGLYLINSCRKKKGEPKLDMATYLEKHCRYPLQKKQKLLDLPSTKVIEANNRRLRVYTNAIKTPNRNKKPKKK